MSLLPVCILLYFVFCIVDLLMQYLLMLIIGFLVKHGADVNAKNMFGVTPLHWGARRGHHRVVAVLIQKGAALNTPANDGHTPLHYSCMTGHNRASLVLLQEGNADDSVVMTTRC